jgi:hypothetical protein
MLYAIGQTVKAVAISTISLLPVAAIADHSQDGHEYERWLDIHNSTGYELCYVYVTHVDRNGWGSDILGSTCLDSGYYRRIDAGWQQGYCRVDMKFVFSDDDVVVRRNFNICTATDFYLE